MFKLMTLPTAAKAFKCPCIAITPLGQIIHKKPNFLHPFYVSSPSCYLLSQVVLSCVTLKPSILNHDTLSPDLVHTPWQPMKLRRRRDCDPN